MAGTLLLGPHCDDLAFSLGGALFGGHFGPLQPVAVFTVSNYSRYRRPAGAAELGKRRQAEERRFFARVPEAAPPLFMDRLDAPLRLGIEPAATRTIRLPLGDEAAALAAEINALAHSCARVVAPLALGEHIDHRLVRAAALHLPERELFFYEDLPYASELPPEAILAAVAKLAAELNGELEPLLLPSASIVPSRQWAVRCYSSQVGPENLELLLAHPRRIGSGGLPAERLWRYAPKRKG